MGRPILLMLVLFAVNVAGEETIRSNCSVSCSPVNEGQPVEIICTFSESLKNKTVELHHHIAGQTEPEIVVKCTWNHSKSSYHCQENIPGYHIDAANITDRIVVRIISAVKSQEGKYSCDIPGVTPSVECVLIINEIPFEAGCEVTPASKGKPTDVVFYLNKIMQVTTKFFITRQPFNAEEKMITVVDCFSNDRKTCIKTAGYHFNESTNSNLLILRIPKASEEHEGIYNILIESTLPPETLPCYFRLQNEQEKPTSYTITTQTTQPPVPSYGADTGQKLTTVFGVIIIALLLVVLIVLVVGVIVVWKRLLPRPPAQSSDNPAAVPLVPVIPQGAIR